MSDKNPVLHIGWQEWCHFPDLNLPAIKAKVDTGARTSALHAFDIEVFKKNRKDFVKFGVHPFQGDLETTYECEAELVDTRVITSSNGEREERHVILTPLVFGSVTIEAELTLTARHNMRFRMLLGREAMQKMNVRVNPSKSFLLGDK